MTIWAGQILSNLRLTVDLIVLIPCWLIMHLGPNVNFYYILRLIREEMGLIMHDQ